MVWKSSRRNSDLNLVDRGVTAGFKQVRNNSKRVYLSVTKNWNCAGSGKSMEEMKVWMIMATVEKKRDKKRDRGTEQVKE